MAPFSRPTRSARSILAFLSSLPALAASAWLLGAAATPSDAATISLAVTGSSVSQTGVLVGGGGGGATPPSLTAPANVRMTARKLCTASPAQSPCLVSDGTSVAQISWYDVSTDDVRTHIERRAEPNGAWTRVQTIASPVTYAASAYDRGLLPDTRYCYRLTAEAADGRAQTSGTTCLVTQIRGDLPVTRAQIRLVVANVPNGGTDGRFAVSLNESPFDLPNGNFTAIATPRDDLEAGSDVTYELNVPGIASFRDVTRISVGSSSTDEFCLEEVQLILNGNENNGVTTGGGGVVYERFYGTTASTCRWVGGIHGPLAVSHADLRAAPEFAAFTGGQPIYALGKTEIEARLEPIIGTLFYERTDIGWDTDQTSAVHVSQAPGGQSLKIHLDLEGFVEGPNPEVDIDFLVTPTFKPTASPTQWTLDLATTNMTASVDFTWWVEVLSGLLDPICAPAVALAEGRDPFLDCISHLEDYIETRIEASFDAPTQPMTVAVPSGCTQPTVTVAADSSVRFGCDAYQRTTNPLTSRTGSLTTLKTTTLAR
ncbi:MAG: hypothetical protein U0900_23335 [Myxococcota bacterium]